MEKKPLRIDETYVALDDASGARPLPVTPEFWNALMSGRLGEMSRMISFSAFDGAWTTWEKHPAGEEVVLLLEGEVELRLDEQGGTESRVRLDAPGSYVLVPRDTWHTARAVRPSRMLFVTPGRGTQHRPV